MLMTRNTRVTLLNNVFLPECCQGEAIPLWCHLVCWSRRYLLKSRINSRTTTENCFKVTRNQEWQGRFSSRLVGWTLRRSFKNDRQMAKRGFYYRFFIRKTRLMAGIQKQILKGKNGCCEVILYFAEGEKVVNSMPSTIHYHHRLCSRVTTLFFINLPM